MIETPHQQGAGRIAQQCLNIFGAGKVSKSPGGQLTICIAAQTVFGAGQDAAVIQAEDFVDDIVGQAVCGIPGGKRRSVEPADAAALGGQPKIALLIFGYIPDKMGAQAGVTILVVESELHAIETHQPLLGADPDGAARILKDFFYGIHRQAVSGRIDAHIILADQFVRIERPGEIGAEE